MHSLTMAPVNPEIIHPMISSFYDKWLKNLDQSVFLRRCREGQITRPELTTFLKQHYWYSRHFTRYLAALLSNLENETDRFDLSQNLFDEMGLGDAGNIPHAQIYRNMMHQMGLSLDQTPLPSTMHLVETMLDCCRSRNYLVGLGALCLGAEGLVPHIYSQIVEGFSAVGETRENLHFFTLHINCDDDHSMTLWKIAQRELTDRPEAVTDFNNGAQAAIEARICFFEGLTRH